MLTKEEIKKIGQLLIATNKESFQLGLEMAQHNLEYVEQWLPLLYAVKHTTYSEQQKEIEKWLIKNIKKPRLDYWQQKTIFIVWIVEARKELSNQKKKAEDIYERAKNDFLGDLDIYEQVLENSYQFNTLYNRLSEHFYYEENDYILATHFALIMYLKEENLNTIWTLCPLLFYYHFQNGSLLFMKEKISTWIKNFIEKEGISYNSLYFKWVEALIQKALGNKPQAIFLLEQNLVWLEQAPHLIRQAKDIVSYIYHSLSVLYAQNKQFTLAKRMYKIGRQFSTKLIYTEARAEIYYQSGDIPKAIKILKEGIKKRPTTEIFWILLGKIYLELRQLDKAIQSFISCIDYSPQYKIYIELLIATLQKSKRPDKEFLIEHYQKVIEDINTSLEELEELVS